MVIKTPPKFKKVSKYSKNSTKRKQKKTGVQSSGLHSGDLSELESNLNLTEIDLRPAVSNPIISSCHYAYGNRIGDVDINLVGQTLKGKDLVNHLVWIGLKDPSDEFITDLCSQLDIHEHALEDILHRHHRPAIVDYGNFVQIVLITMRRENKKIIQEEFQLIFGAGFLFTIRRGEGLSNRHLRKRLELSPDMIARGSDFVAAEILEVVADSYSALLAGLEKEVKNAERDMMIRGFREKDIRKLYRLRRDMLSTHTILGPTIEICRRLSMVRIAVVEADSRSNYSIVADRITRADEHLNALSQSLAFAFEASVMMNDIHQTDITKKLAAWAAILAVPTAIAGIYGMNFKFMPELEWTYSYPVLMIVMFSICAILFYRFKKHGWI